MKKSRLVLISVSFILTLGAGVLVAHAQGYTPLAPIKGIDITSATPARELLPTYLSGALKLLIALGGVLSILMAVIAGTKFVAAGISPDAKSNAKSDMTNALIGLALILSSYLILNSINPNLVALNFSLTNISAPVSSATTATSGSPWHDDTSIRNELKNTYGIDINKPNCTNIGDYNCTSVYELSTTALEGLKALSIGFHQSKTNCPLLSPNSDCRVMITGGTEYWLHGNRDQNMSSNTTYHKPGGSVVDLSKNNTSLNNYIEKGGLASSQTGCALGKHYQVGTAVYVDEEIAGNAPHWHVCY